MYYNTPARLQHYGGWDGRQALCKNKETTKKIGREDLFENGFGYAQICFALMFALEGRNIKEIFVRWRKI
jgi:hypothetical protein